MAPEIFARRSTLLAPLRRLSRVVGVIAILTYAGTASAAEVLRLEHCLVSAVDDVQVPALSSGLLKRLFVHEGDQIAAAKIAAQIDDAQVRLQLEATTAEFQAQETRANSELEMRFATATHDVASAEHTAAKEANAKVENSVSSAEVRRLLLAAEQAAIKIDVTKFDRAVRKIEMTAAKAKMTAASAEVERRAICAPLDGEIAEIYVRAGEWVEAGTPIVRIIRLDLLRVEGFVNVKEVLPADVHGREVEVSIELAQGKRFSFPGKIKFVSPLVQPGGDYRIWAEVTNRKDRAQWLLRPGLEAEMTLNAAP